MLNRIKWNDLGKKNDGESLKVISLFEYYIYSLKIFSLKRGERKEHVWTCVGRHGEKSKFWRSHFQVMSHGHICQRIF